MSLSKEEIIGLSDKFRFKPFPTEATATSDGENGNEFASCGNHRDEQFMKLLDDGAHLDLTLMPL